MRGLTLIWSIYFSLLLESSLVLSRLKALDSAFDGDTNLHCMHAWTMHLGKGGGNQKIIEYSIGKWAFFRVNCLAFVVVGDGVFLHSAV